MEILFEMLILNLLDSSSISIPFLVSLVSASIYWYGSVIVETPTTPRVFHKLLSSILLMHSL
ncbi:MAG: hypothetical protein QW095_04860 [Nitrososphaerota archaeon]